MCNIVYIGYGKSEKNILSAFGERFASHIPIKNTLHNDEKLYYNVQHPVVSFRSIFYGQGVNFRQIDLLHKILMK